MLRMLVVEGNESDGKRLRDAVLDAGYAVAGLAGTAAGARSLIDAARPDLVLLDERLAGTAAERPDLAVILLSDGEGGAVPDGFDGEAPPGRLRRPVEPAALRAAVELEQWKRRMVRDLRRERRAAAAAERAKTSFLATISHELRTPMNGVLGMSELLLLSELEEPYRDSVELIRQSALSLLGVLNQIIDYSRLEAGSLHPRESDFRLEDLLTGVLSQHRRTATIKGLGLGYTLDPALPGWVRGDAGKIRQALGNLLANAVKYTGSGQVMVDVSLEARPDRASAPDLLPVRVLVQDTGIGIPADRLEAIFDSFVQGADYLAHATGSLGLGLAIVNRLVTVLGGTVRCSSEPGRGSVFTFDLVLRRSRYEVRSPLETALGADKPLSGVRVLVAEDEPVNQRYLTRLLEKMGCAVTLAGDGREAVRALRAAPCDIALMDLEMPGMGGIEATRAIRDPRTGCLDPTVPIVALTAHAMWGDEQRCLHAGMTDYVAKPADIETVAAIIHSTLEDRRARPDGAAASGAFVHGD